MDIVQEINMRLEAILMKFEETFTSGVLEKGMLDKELVEFVIFVLKKLLEYYETEDYMDIADFLHNFGYHFFHGPNGDDENYLQYSEIDFYDLDAIPYGSKCDRKALEDLLEHYLEL